MPKPWNYYDLIEWAGMQSWSSGLVGLDGVSYLAISQYKVAALKPPSGGVREDGFSISGAS
jgi:predicted acyl esterase